VNGDEPAAVPVVAFEGGPAAEMVTDELFAARRLVRWLADGAPIDEIHLAAADGGR
jgi:hypothetical protein